MVMQALRDSVREHGGIAIPLVIDGMVILAGSYMLGVLTTKIDNLATKVDKISEAQVAVIQQRVSELEKFRDKFEFNVSK